MAWAHGLVLIALLAASPATAYPTPVDFDGTLSRWNLELGDGPITYEIDADQEDDAILYGAAVDDAAAMWSDVPTSYFTYAAAQTGETADVTVHLKSSIDGESYSAGYAIFDAVNADGPTHCSIYVGINADQSYPGLAKTFLHELGHCVGLGHSVIPQAIMSYKLDENSFALDIDDQAGVSRLYPADGSKPRLPPGCAAGSATKGGGCGGVIIVLTGLLIWVGTLKPRRRRA
jgi:hypothetical protein